jgi:hypothetical protein
MGKSSKGGAFTRTIPLTLTFLVTLLGVAIPLSQAASQTASESAAASCGGDARVYIPSSFPMNCSGSPGALEIQNTLSDNVVLTMTDSGGAALGSISPTSGAPAATNLFNAIESNQEIGPSDMQAVTYGSGAGTFSVSAAPEGQQKLWATLSLVADDLPVGVVGYPTALKSADQAWSSENANYFSCLGTSPNAKKTASCMSELQTEVGGTDATLAAATGLKMGGGPKKAISAALAQTSVATFTTDAAQQFKKIPLADRTATIVAGAVGVGPKSNVLILGNGDPDQDSGYTSFSFLDASLSTIGLTVTSLPGTTALPSNISQYGQVWWDGTQNLSQVDEHTLESFVHAGGSVYINGEYGEADLFDNQSVLDIVQDLVSPSISVSGIDGGTNPLSANPNVVDGVAGTPNPLTTWTPNGEGTLTGVATSNTLFPEGYGASGAVWDVGKSGGRLAVLMDVNWAESSYYVEPTATQVAENLGEFLSN